MLNNKTLLNVFKIWGLMGISLFMVLCVKHAIINPNTFNITWFLPVMLKVLNIVGYVLLVLSVVSLIVLSVFVICYMFYINTVSVKYNKKRFNR